jgi:hypothetical protein
MSDNPEMVEATWMDIAIAVDDHMTKLRTENEKLRAAVQDLAKHVWRGDWDKLKPETRELLGEKE